MKELVIISGKGGTGKTSLTAAFAAFSENGVICDGDVDAADLHLLTAPVVKQQIDFNGGGIAVINPEKCIECGQCIELCRFEAISESFKVDGIACEGCGVCVDLCPEKAIDFPVKTCGQWFVSDTRFGPMVHARLGIAEENSGRLVALVRKEAKSLAEEIKADLLITDGPPGVGCPVIAAISGADALLIVTEPTVSGVHDLDRVMALAAHFKIPSMVCVNKFDLNPDQARIIEDIAKKRGSSVVGRIPFDPLFTKSMVCGQTVVEFDPDSYLTGLLKEIWNGVISSPELNRKKGVELTRMV